MISLLQGFSQALMCVVIHQGMDTEARILQNALFTEPFIFVYLFFFGTFTLRNILEVSP